MDYEKALQAIEGARLMTNAVAATRDREATVALAIVDIAESLNYLSCGNAGRGGVRPDAGEILSLQTDDFTLVGDYEKGSRLVAAIAHDIDDDDRRRIIALLEAGLTPDVMPDDEDGDLPWHASIDELVLGAPVRHRSTDRAGTLGTASGISEGEPWVDVVWRDAEGAEKVWISELGPDFGEREGFGGASLPLFDSEELADEQEDGDYDGTL
jgi:hypothetical protein